MKQITLATTASIRFRAAAMMNQYYASFKRPDPGGCDSNIGFQRDNANQIINLHPTCFSDDDGKRTWITAAHEMIHLASSATIPDQTGTIT